MRFLQSTGFILLAFSLLASTSLFAGLEIELAAGKSTKNLASFEDEETEIPISSNDFTFYAGYRFHSFLSLGLAASQKSYDLKEAAQSFSILADEFFNNTEVFPSPPLREGDKASGTFKGSVIGPQLTFAYPGKFFQPYLRFAYLTGSMTTTMNYSADASYASLPINFQMQYEDKVDASFTQVGLGFRLAFAKFFFFTDYFIESMKLKVKSTKVTNTLSIDTDLFEISDESTETENDSGGGTLAKLGVGFEF